MAEKKYSRVGPNVSLGVWIAVIMVGCFCTSTLSRADQSGIHIGKLIQPAPKSAIFANDGFFVWGASMVRTEDGICHLFYSRWPKPFQSWRKKSEIAYAIADKPFGHYHFQRVVLKHRGKEFWDGVSVYNPQVLQVGDKYYLYYTGNNGSIRSDRDKEGNLITQRIGVAIANHPAGPWRRTDVPLIDVSKEGLDSNFVCNPAITQSPDDHFLMVYKCGDGVGTKGRVYHTTAESKTPLGPFVKTRRNIFYAEASNFPAEDPFVWYQNGKYYALIKDMHGAFSKAGPSIVQFESKNGHRWEPSEPVVVSKREIHWDDGIFEKVNRFERPQIWFENGIARILFIAVKKGNSSYNVRIPLSPKK